MSDERTPTAPDADDGTLRLDADAVTAPHAETDADDDLDPSDEGDLVDLVRLRLGLGVEISDVTIAASLAAISARAEMRARWLAAFGSPLGRVLAARGVDLNTALNTLLALAPRAAS